MIAVLHVMGRMATSGTELQLAGMLRAAQDTHWKPTLCVLRPGWPLADQLAADGLDVIELGGPDSSGRHRGQRLRALIRHGGYDVVHPSLWGASAVTRAALIGPGRPAVVMSERRVEDFRPRSHRLLDRALATVTDEWIGNSPDVAAFVRRAHHAPADRVHVITNGIDTAVFHPVERPPRQPGQLLRVGGLGRLVHQKGFDVLIAAAPTVLRRHDVRFTVRGDGELRDELTAAAAGLPIDFAGPLATPAEVAAYLQGLDVFVMPSRYEGLPNAVLEAIACGLDVVATDVAGMRAAVGPEATLVAPDDPGALAAGLDTALAQLTRQPELTGQTAGEPPRAPGPSPRSFDDVAADHLAVFEQALATRTARRRATP